MKGIEVRAATAEDAEAIHAVEARCFDSPWSAESLRSHLSLKSSLAFIVLDGGRVAGYILLQLAADEAEVLKLAVLPEKRRQGMATLLLNHTLSVLERMKTCSSVYLEVSASNKPAINMYCKSGFDQIAQRKNYYNNPQEDAVLMRRMLSSKN